MSGNMNGKLDRSLEDILGDKKRAGGPRRSTRRSTKPTKPAVAAAGGVTKNTRNNKAVPKAVPTGPANSGTSKIIVSNLPTDVTETHIKEYFVSTIGPVRKVLLTYGPNGQSRGVATVIFGSGMAAAEAAKLLDGTKVDGRPMRVEVVLAAKEASSAPAIKALADRVSNNQKGKKNAPKSAAAEPKAKGNSTNKREKKTARPKKKTAEELDAEMKDYFDAGTGASGNVDMGNAPAVQPVAAGGDAMDDEIL